MELSEINGLTDEQIKQIEKVVQGHEDRVRTDYSKQLKDAQTELAKYKPAEKSESEKALEQKIAELEAKEKVVADKEKSITVAEKLKNAGLPADLAQYINIGEDVDKTIESVGATLGSYFLNKGAKPTNHTTNKGVTKETFQKMGYSERARLYQEDPELYRALNN